MTIAHFMDFTQSKNCYYDGQYPKIAAEWMRYKPDCQVQTAYGNYFRMRIKSADIMYNELAKTISSYEAVLFTNKAYNRSFNCSIAKFTMKSVIDRLIMNYPDKVRIAETCGTVPKYPLKIDSLESSIIGTKIQLKINVSGDLPGRARIIWGSLANSEIVMINPTEVKSVTYEKVLSPGDHTICVSEVD